MRRLSLVCLVLLLALGALASPALASPTAELAALAQYFPSDTPLFAAVRTDDAIIAELDTVLARVLSKLPEGIVPPDISLQAALDQIAREADLNDFSEIRAWLGDYAAAGRIMNDDPSTSASEGTLFVAQITDRAAAEAFWKAILDRSGGQDYTVKDGDTYTLYAIETDPPVDAGLLFTDDVMLLGVADLPQLLLTRDAKLVQNDTFQQTLNLLPAEQYSGLVYVDTTALAELSQGSQGLASTLLGQQAVGFTLLDDRSLVLDVASKLGDMSALTGMGVSLPELQPINPAFAANLPADDSLVAHSTNLTAIYESLLATARATAEQNGESPEEFEKGINQLKFAVRGFTGLDLEEDILSWMTGDFALFASVDSAALNNLLMQGMSGEQPVFETLPFSAGLIIEATDADKARALAAGITKALPQLIAQNPDLTLSDEQIGGTDVTVLSAPIEIQPDYKVPFDVIIGANDAVFVIATRDAATAVLTTIGGGASGLAADPAFVEASQYMLPNASSFWYMDNDGFSFFAGFTALGMLGPSIGSVFEGIVADLESGQTATLTPGQIQQQQEAAARRQQEQMQQVQAVLTFLNTVFNSGTISTTSVEGGAVTRLVLTLAE